MGRAFQVLAVHKKQYVATHNFWKEANGTSGTDITFVDTAILYNGACEIISEWQSHKKVLRLTDDATAGEDPFIVRNETQATAGTREFWLGTDNVTEYWEIFFFEGGSDYIIRLRITASNFDYMDNGDVWQSIQAVANNTLYHVKVVWRADNTFDVWVDGILKVDNQATNNNQASGIDQFRIRSYGDSTDHFYIDAYGDPDNDANYKIGDNCFWRHYKESDDPFESEDVGTKSLSIDWIDSISLPNFAEIIAEFNEHKKIIDNFSNSAVQQMAEHYLPSASTAGWFAVWLKTDDVTLESRIYIEDAPDLCILFRIFNTQFQVYTAAAWRQATGSPTPANDTYYFIYIQWYADNTFDLWIDNILYEDGTANNINQTDGIDRVGISSTGTADPLTVHTYFDAPTCSLDAASPERGDNRIFDYNSTYTSEDITSTITNVITENKLGLWRTGTMYSNTSYENSEIFVQVYDINSKLGIEADLKKRDQVEGGMKYEYPLRDKNQDDLEHESSNTFTADAIHDPTDSTSMLKVILPNVGEVEGDLLLVDGDTKATTYSPTTHDYPDYKMLLDIGDLADSVVIVHADGKCYLDDDKASGTTLDYDTSADFDKMTKPILVTDILEDVNYLEIRGAINPETGVRFYKIIDNTGTDKKRSWRYTNDQFESQADVDAYAAALELRAITAKLIKISAQSVGAHNMGETINYKYVKSPYNVPQANYYIIYEEIDYDQNHNIIILSEGMIEGSKYAAGFERSETNSYAGSIHATDINSFPLFLYPSGGSYASYGRINMNAAGEEAQANFYTSDKLDATRPIKLYFVYYINALAGDGALNVTMSAVRRPSDCVADSSLAAKSTTMDLTCTTASRVTEETLTIAAANVYGDNIYWIRCVLNDGPPADLDLLNIMVEYYQLREV